MCNYFFEKNTIISLINSLSTKELVVRKGVIAYLVEIQRLCYLSVWVVYEYIMYVHIAV